MVQYIGIRVMVASVDAVFGKIAVSPHQVVEHRPADVHSII